MIDTMHPQLYAQRNELAVLLAEKARIRNRLQDLRDHPPSPDEVDEFDTPEELAESYRELTRITTARAKKITKSKHKLTP